MMGTIQENKNGKSRDLKGLSSFLLGLIFLFAPVNIAILHFLYLVPMTSIDSTTVFDPPRFLQSDGPLLQPKPACQSVNSTNKNPSDNCSVQALLHPETQQSKCQNNEKNIIEKKPCALLFFGLAKQFRSIVLPSINEFILRVSNHSQCDVYAHTYNITQGTNETSARHPEEIGVKMDTKEIYDLTSNVIIDTNEDFLAKRNLEFLLQKRFIPPTDYLGWDAGALTNMYKQWHSIERVWDLMEQNERKLSVEYERVGLFRSDVKYVNPINIFDGDAVIPDFGFIVNDRMFYGLREYSEIWAKIRFPGMNCYKPRHTLLGMHSEFYMEDFILKHIPNVTKDQNICFYRVRGNGDVWEHDCEEEYKFPLFLKRAGLVQMRHYNKK